MIKRVTTIFLILLILTPMMYLKPAAAQKIGDSKTVTVYFPAVIIHEKTNETILIKTDVTVKNGTGQVIITGAQVDELFRLSTKASAIISSFIYNFDFWTYDYHVDISFNKTKTTLVAGPSGSLALALAYYAAVTGVELDNSVITSGMVNPDGTIGQVSYLEEKAAGLADDFKKFLFPLDQDVTRINVTKEKRIGIYPIEYKKLIIEQLNLNVDNIISHQVGSIFEATKMSLKLNEEKFIISPNMPNIIDENLTLLATENYNMLLFETLQKSDSLKSTIDLLIFRSETLEQEINAILENSDAIIALSWLAQKEGSVFASIEILLQGYLNIKYAEYLIGLLLNNFRAELILQDVRSEFLQANNLMNDPDLSSIEAMKMNAYSKFLLIEATNLFDSAGPILKFIYLARSDKLLMAAQEGAVKMAQANTLAKKSYLLQNLASSMSGTFSIKKEDTYTSASRYVQAVKTIYLYAYEVSLASKVYSPFIAQAGYNLFNAERNVNLDPLLAMTYATETYFYISTYMALHPGYAEIANARLPYIQNSTWNIFEIIGGQNTPFISWTFNQFADALVTNSSRVMSYEKAFSYLILDRVIAKDYKTGQVYTDYQNWRLVEEHDIEQSQSIFTWINMFSSLIPIVLLTSVLSVGDRINPLKKLAALLFRSESSKRADKHL
ncbi:hypothetical protein ACFL96_09835 [Thermoproteota archaeon]